MKCCLYVWIFIFTFSLRLNEDRSECATITHPPARSSTICLDTFTSLLNYISAQSKKLSKECRTAAADERTCLLSESRTELASIVRRIYQPLLECELRNDILSYFRCLKDIMKEVEEMLDDVCRKSTKVIEDYSPKLIEIDNNEKDCLKEVLQKIQVKSDQAFADYSKCLSTATCCSCKSSTTTPSIDWEEHSKIDPSSEVNIQPRSTRNSVGIIAVTVGFIVLVIIVLIATCLYRNNEWRPNRFQLMNDE